MEQVRQILTLAQFPTEAEEYLWSAWQSVAAEEALMELVKQAADMLFEKQDSVPVRQAIAEKSGLHQYTADLLVLLYAHVRLRQEYARRGYSDALFAETMSDLRFKLEECRQVHGVWGNFVFHWYSGFFDFTRFKLGRLQYEYFTPTTDCGGLHPEGTPLLRCHIPSAGPLTAEAILDSLKQAYIHFGYAGPMAVHCASWLLYPPHYEVYPEGSNLRKFFDLFTIYSQNEDPKNGNAWRVFGTMDPDPDHWQLTTSLRRRFHSFITAGNNMGMGRGILFYTPERGVYKEKA